ncbi:MAG TPA: hypothetical protein VF132_14530 [Rudaea sp.]
MNGRHCFGILLACALAPVHAASGDGPALTALLPARAIYYDVGKPGTGVAVDVGRDGDVFLAYFGYDELGAPTWYSLQSRWAPNTEAQRIATGRIGALAGPLLAAHGGQCITCDFTGKPTVAPALSATAQWSTPRHLDLTIGDESWSMDAVAFGPDDAHLLTGTWSLTIGWNGGDTGNIAARTQILTLAEGVAFDTLPIPTYVVRDPAADPAIALPPPGSIDFAASSAGTCAPGPVREDNYGAAFTDLLGALQTSSAFAGYPDAAVFPAPLFWYDPASRRGGLDIATRAMGVDTVSYALGPNSVHFDLYVEPDRIVGHGRVIGANLKNVPAQYWRPDAVMLDLVMQRLPDGYVERSILPCQLY